MNLNSSPFPVEKINDHDQHHQAFNHQLVSSSPSSHFFFASTQDRAGFYHGQYSYQPHHQQDESYTYQGGSSYEIKNKVESSLELGLWKKEDQGLDNDQVKWLSSKMRMKNHDHKLQRTSSSFQTHNYISSIPIRVCSDCHTTKTPLWRSGPKGPKSLCNACGIRQRKARRAMAAAAAARSTVVASDQPPPVKMYKAKMAKNAHSLKRCKMAGEPSESGGKKKVDFEDFLINLSNKLAFHRVFPQDEKDAAILLMAISSGLVHG